MLNTCTDYISFYRATIHDHTFLAATFPHLEQFAASAPSVFHSRLETSIKVLFLGLPPPLLCISDTVITDAVFVFVTDI